MVQCCYGPPFRVSHRGSVNPPPSGGRKVREIGRGRSDVRMRMVRFKMVLGAEQRGANGCGTSGWLSAWTVGRMANDHRLEPYPGNPRLQARVCSFQYETPASPGRQQEFESSGSPLVKLASVSCQAHAEKIHGRRTREPEANEMAAQVSRGVHLSYICEHPP